MKITNKHDLPSPLYRCICWAVERYEGPKLSDMALTKKISVTTLINPPRLTLLRAQHDAELEVDASDLMYLVQGIAFHHLMAEVGFIEEGFVSETRVDRSFEGWVISGGYDVLGSKERLLSDWKWTSVWSVVSPRFEWAAQLNLYRWLEQGRGGTIDRLENWAALRDWSQTKANKDKRIPEIPFARLGQKVWADVVTEAYIRDRLALYDRALSRYTTSGNNANVVECCTPEERWERGPNKPARCMDYCDVAQFCSYGKAYRKS